MRSSVGIRSLAVNFPSLVRTNEYWRRKYPKMVADAAEKTLARVFSADGSSSSTQVFDAEMLPYVSDPFRGTVERRYLAPGETSVDVELKAARDALAAASVSPDQVDAMIVASFIPNSYGPGDAPFLARALGLRCTSWNVESACTGTFIALQNAYALVAAGQYRRVLVVVSCSYSRMLDEQDTLSWFMGDGAGAFLVEAVPEGEGLLATKLVSTADTCGAFVVDLIHEPGAEPRPRMRLGDQSGRLPRDTSAEYLHACCDHVLRDAGVSKDEISCFVFNTPVAWFHMFGARALEVDPKKTLSTYPMFANMGPALTPVNLYHAASAGMIKPGDLVMCFGIGFASNAAACVMRWGDVALGPPPPPSSELTRE